MARPWENENNGIGKNGELVPNCPIFLRFYSPDQFHTVLLHFLECGGGGGQGQSNDPGNNQHNPQYANYWAPLTPKRHIPPHPAQPQHTNHWAPRTRKRHPQEHRPQRPTERSDPTQHAKGRTGDCPGPRKGATTRRNVTWGGGGGNFGPTIPPGHTTLGAGPPSPSQTCIVYVWGGGGAHASVYHRGGSRAVVKEPHFFLRRTALEDRHQLAAAIRHQPPPTGSRHPAPTATNRQPPSATNRHQPAAATRHQPPPTGSRHPPPTATNRQPPPT